MTVETDWLGGASAPPAPSPGGRPPKDHKGRQRKLLCDGCGFIAYATAGAVERAGGLPTCACGERMTVPNLRDRAVIEWDALDAELHALGGDAYRAAMRELGETPEREHGGKYGRGGAGPARCQWAEGYCMKFVSTRFCPEHDPHEIAARDRAGRRGI